MKIFKTLLVIMMFVVTQVQGMWGQPNAQYNQVMWGQTTPVYQRSSYGLPIQYAQAPHSPYSRMHFNYGSPIQCEQAQYSNPYLLNTHTMQHRGMEGILPWSPVSNWGTWFGSSDFRLSAQPNAQGRIDISDPNSGLQAWNSRTQQDGVCGWGDQSWISNFIPNGAFIFTADRQPVESYPPRPAPRSYPPYPDLPDVSAWQGLKEILAGTSSIDESKAMPPAERSFRVESHHTTIPSRRPSFDSQDAVSTFIGSLSNSDTTESVSSNHVSPWETVTAVIGSLFDNDTKQLGLPDKSNPNYKTILPHEFPNHDKIFCSSSRQY